MAQLIPANDRTFRAEMGKWLMGALFKNYESLKSNAHTGINIFINVYEHLRTNHVQNALRKVKEPV